MKEIKVAYIGMTHLGLVSAVASAEKGFHTICYDSDSSRIERLKNGEVFIVEPRLCEGIKKNSSRLAFTADLAELKKADLAYIAYDVPTNDRGESDLSPIYQLIQKITPYLEKQAILVVLSQVPPGFTRSISFEPKRLFYQVETLVFGKALERALYPERFIVGAFQPNETLPPSFFAFLSSFGCPLLPMRYESAELAKIAINMFLVSSVSTTNTLAAFCEKMGADWREIIPSLRLDKRIGEHAYLEAGLGLSGGNLERDLSTFCTLADQIGSDSSVVRSWLANSSHQRDWVLRKIHEKVLSVLERPTFAVLGLAYKKNTSSIKNSPAIALLSFLQAYKVKAFDPAVGAIPDCFLHLELVNSAESACEQSDCLLIMTPWDEFSTLSIPSTVKTIIDPFGVLKCFPKQANYFRLGVYETAT